MLIIMAIEHLIAGVIDRSTGRAHHPDDIPGYIGNRRRVGHGQGYPSSKTGFIEYHGLTDNLNGPPHERALAAAKRKLASGPSSRHYQKMSEEYKRPPAGY